MDNIVTVAADSMAAASVAEDSIALAAVDSMTAASVAALDNSLV